jgi:hypothetical protein
MKDSCLLDLGGLLRDIAMSGVKDIRKTLRRFRDTMMRLYSKGDQDPYETLRKLFKKENM